MFMEDGECSRGLAHSDELLRSLENEGISNPVKNNQRNKPSRFDGGLDITKKMKGLP